MWSVIFPFLLTIAFICSLSFLAGCGSETVDKPVAKQSATGQESPPPAQTRTVSPSASNTDWQQEVVALRAKGDLASLHTVQEKLHALINTQPQNPQVYLQLGLSYYDEAQAVSQPQRETLDELYQQAVEHLETAKTLLVEEKRPLRLYQALWSSYRDLALLPVTFNQGTDPDKGVVPLHVKHMQKAVEVFAEAKAKYPADPAVDTDIANKLQADMQALEEVYVANVQRQWNELNESGYRRPETYQHQ